MWYLKDSLIISLHSENIDKFDNQKFQNQPYEKSKISS